VAPPRGPKRIAAHIKKGNVRYGGAKFGRELHQKTMIPTASSNSARTAASAKRRKEMRGRGPVLQVNTNGAITRSLSTSPAHQGIQVGPNSESEILPPSHTLVTPIVALTTLLSRPASRTSASIP